MFQGLLAICDEVTVLCDEYTPQCFFIRNRYLVDKSNWVLAVYDGRQTGGIFYTMQYAQKQYKEIQMITVKEEENCLSGHAVIRIRARTLYSTESKQQPKADISELPTRVSSIFPSCVRNMNGLLKKRCNFTVCFTKNNEGLI